ncbi:hypothetical protein D3C71_1571140 [compost metagenome]
MVKFCPDVFCMARRLAWALAGETVPEAVRIVETGRSIGAPWVDTTVLLPATTGTLRTMPVARPVGTITTSTLPDEVLCSIGDSTKLPLASATVDLTTSPPRSA